MYELHTLGRGAIFLSQVGVSLDVLPQTGVDILLRNAQQHTLVARWDSEPPYLGQGFTPGVEAFSNGRKRGRTGSTREPGA